MSLFKKRKHNPATRKATTSLDALQDEEEVTTQQQTKKAAGLVASTSVVNQTATPHSFESSASAMPAGKLDQGAAVDVSDDYAPRISATSNKSKAGPVKYSSNFRITCQFDYQPNICKDYKETGYCGYGDSCKFLHDRGDYKLGWQIDQEWEATQQSKKREMKNVDPEKGEFYIGSDSEDNDSLPFGCGICRERFTSPIMTKCKHYFCEDCALQHHKKDHRCFTCKEKTGGIFNVAHDIAKKIREREERQRLRGPLPDEPEEVPEDNSHEQPPNEDSD